MSDLRKQDRKWLQHIGRMSDSTAMYPGDRCDFLPEGPMRRLYQRGLIQTFTPHNGAHKERYVITPAGRAALAASHHGSGE